MAPVCHGVCHRYKPNWLGMAAGSVRYTNTTCRCTTCATWLIIESGIIGNRCRCCNTLVKRKPKAKDNRQKLQQRSMGAKTVLVCKVD